MNRSARCRIRSSIAAPALAVLLPLATLALQACGGGSRAPVGVSTGSTGPAQPAVRDAGAPRGPSGIPSDFRTNLTKINRARFVSNGHAGGRYEVDVYANAAGKAAATSNSGDVAVGARLVKEHFERTGEGVQPGPVMMMEKMERGFDPEHGDWAYLVVNSAGQPVQNGRVEACVGCHDDAPHDHVFRVQE
ncbi:cytochrome P460 family protein [Pendulispora brunnea]|uniref:Cytochrome P460 family protein n=1 Tax=Pendulispora brunnea TaxID=2905690 RepID=A0ABZ2K3U7_9BACT